MDPERLSDYPAVTVNVSCKLCPRRGRYKLTRLAARFGPDATLDDVLAKLAAPRKADSAMFCPRGRPVRRGGRLSDDAQINAYASAFKAFVMAV